MSSVPWCVSVVLIAFFFHQEVQASSGNEMLVDSHLRQTLVQTEHRQEDTTGGIPADIEMFIRPPLAAPSEPTLISKTDSSMEISWTFDSSTDLTKAVDVTNVTTLSSLAQLTGGRFKSNEGLSTDSPLFFELHPILEAYKTRHVNLSLPLFQTLPAGKQRVFLRKPVKRFVVQTSINAPAQPLESEEGWSNAASLDVSELHAELENLLPGMEYRVRVCSANSEGTGVCGPAALFHTSNVPSKPSRPALVRATSKTLELDIPKPTSTNGSPLTEINLEMSRKHNGPWDMVEYSMAVRKPLITDLEPGATYFFRTRAWNQIGPSEYSDPASFDTLAMVPKTVPEFAVAEQVADLAAGTTRVVLRWGSPDPRGRPVTDYEMHKAMGAAPEESEFVLECLTEGHNCTVHELRAGKMYQFRVRAINDVGPGNWTDNLQVITAPSVTTPPQDLEVLSTEARSVSLRWAPPHDFRGAPPSAYLLQMQTVPLETHPDPSKPVYWNDVYRGPSLEVTVGQDKVLPAHSYVFRVKALNMVGSSNASSEARTATQATTPDAPQAPIATNITTTSVEIAWNIPEPNGAPILSYRLKYALASDVLHNTSRGNNSTNSTSDKLGHQMMLLSSDVAVMRGSLVTLLNADDDGKSKATPGRSTTTRKPCKAISPSVYDMPIPDRFLLPPIIPGSQPVYPVKPGSSREISPSATPEPRLEDVVVLSNATAAVNSTHKPAGPRISRDGFMEGYSGPLNATTITGLIPGQTYVFAVQATTEIGTSPMSQYATVTTLPDVPRRPRAPHQDSRGHNFISFSWPPAIAQGSAVSSYVVQISEGKDKRGEQVFQNTCLRKWPPILGGEVMLYNFTTRRDSRLEKGLTDLQVETDANGVPMDHCKHSAEDTESHELTCCVDGLEPEKSYLFRVLAVSAVGLSAFGPATEMRTLGDVPQTALTPRVVRGTSTSLDLAWEPTPGGSWDVHSVKYVLQMTDIEFGATRDVYEGPALNTTVTGLLQDHSYWFRVQATNHNGKGGASEFVRAHTCGSPDATCSGTAEPPRSAAPAQSEAAILKTQLAMNEKLRLATANLHLNQHAVTHHPRPVKHY